jgi:hypothetical protein
MGCPGIFGDISLAEICRNSMLATKVLMAVRWKALYCRVLEPNV